MLLGASCPVEELSHISNGGGVSWLFWLDQQAVNKLLIMDNKRKITQWRTSDDRDPADLHGVWIFERQH
jgi:hypothetical protein